VKPILFNTEMTKAILDGRKSVTRRIAKGIPNDAEFTGWLLDSTAQEDVKDIGKAGFKTKGQAEKAGCVFIKPPYKVGDILYVRETWGRQIRHGGCFTAYKADDENAMNYDVGADGSYPTTKIKWHPSIHMPKEAARIFLQVTDVRVERVQKATYFDFIQEGLPYKQYEKDLKADFVSLWNECYAAPRPVKENGIITHYESYPYEDIQKTRTYKGIPWQVYGNPWVWVTEFTRCEKPKED
jgi:hypothetical protein